MAGDVNKIQEPTWLAECTPQSDGGDEMPWRQRVREKSFDEFHLYTLQRPTTLRDEETKQVEFVSSTGIHAQRPLIYDGAQIAQYGYYNPDQIRPGPELRDHSNPKVWVMEEFKNSEGNHLGIPLPKGKLRFYRRDTDGHLEFVGENTIDHTPKDETIRVYTGNASMLSASANALTTAWIQTNTGWMKRLKFAFAITRKIRSKCERSSICIAGRIGRSPSSLQISARKTRRPSSFLRASRPTASRSLPTPCTIRGSRFPAGLTT